VPSPSGVIRRFEDDDEHEDDCDCSFTVLFFVRADLTMIRVKLFRVDLRTGIRSTPIDRFVLCIRAN
jgi:hypothetical protein